MCGYLLVRGGVHAHAYALALKNLTGVEIEKMLPTPNINLSEDSPVPEVPDEGSHRRLYTFSPEDYAEISGIWGNGEMAFPNDPLASWKSSKVCRMVQIRVGGHAVSLHA